MSWKKDQQQGRNLRRAVQVAAGLLTDASGRPVKAVSIYTGPPADGRQVGAISYAIDEGMPIEAVDVVAQGTLVTADGRRVHAVQLFDATGAEVAGGPPTVPAFLGQVATRAIIPSDKTAANTMMMCRTMHVARTAIASLQVAYPGWFPDSGVSGQELAAGGNLTIKASVEYNGAIVGTLQWAASAAGTIVAGQTLLSDVCVLTQAIPDGATFYLRPFVTAAVAGIPYTTTGGNGDGVFAAGEACNQGTAGVADLTAATGAFAGTTAIQNFYPVAIVANTTKPSFLLIGDSRTVGSRGTPNGSGDFGEAALSIGATHPYIACGASGDTAYAFSRRCDRRLELAAYCSHVIVGFPINDVRSGGKARTAAQVQSDMRNVWALLAGKPIIQLTSSPWSTSTDAFATVGNQTTDTGNPARTAFNDLVRAVPAPLAAEVDICSVLESSANSGLWKAGYTGEGGHPNDTGYAALAAAGIIAGNTLAARAKVAQLWDPSILFPKGVGAADIAHWVVADEETCTGPGTSILFGKNNELAWVQATAGKQPVREAAIMNGRKAWHFTGANLQDVSGSAIAKKITNGQPGLLVVAVIRSNGANGAQQQIILNSRNGSGVSNRASLAIDATGKVFTSVRRAEGDTGANQTGTTVLAAGGDYIILAQIDLTTNTVRLRINGADEVVSGTPVPAGSGNWPATDSSSITFGSTNGSNYFDGWIAELLQIPGVFSQANMEKLEGRLASLYAIPLAVGHPYKNVPPLV